MRFFFSKILFSYFLLFSIFSLTAESVGRVELAPAFIHIDILESGKTVKRMDLLALRGESTIRVHQGLCVKPLILYGAGRGDLISAGLGIGYLLPIQEKWFFTPVLGLQFTDLRTKIDLPHFGLFQLKERFRSLSPYLGLEATYKFSEAFRASASIQYALSRTHTTIKHLVSDRSHTEGFNYAFMLEKDFNKKWSFNLGAAYNISLSREKHGLRAFGVKSGIAYWF